MGQNKSFLGDWLGNAVMDDQLWHQAIVTERRLTEDLWCSPTTEDEKILGYLLRMGAVDPGPKDGEWSTSV